MLFANSTDVQAGGPFEHPCDGWEQGVMLQAPHSPVT